MTTRILDGKIEYTIDLKKAGTNQDKLIKIEMSTKTILQNNKIMMKATMTSIDDQANSVELSPSEVTEVPKSKDSDELQAFKK